MKLMLNLFDGRRVAVEQTMTGIIASVDGGEPQRITSEKYVQLIAAAV